MKRYGSSKARAPELGPRALPMLRYLPVNDLGLLHRGIHLNHWRCAIYSCLCSSHQSSRHRNQVGPSIFAVVDPEGVEPSSDTRSMQVNALAHQMYKAPHCCEASTGAVRFLPLHHPALRPRLQIYCVLNNFPHLHSPISTEGHTAVSQTMYEVSGGSWQSCTIK